MLGLDGWGVASVVIFAFMLFGIIFAGEKQKLPIVGVLLAVLVIVELVHGMIRITVSIDWTMLFK